MLKIGVLGLKKVILELAALLVGGDDNSGTDPFLVDSSLKWFNVII